MEGIDNIQLQRRRTRSTRREVGVRRARNNNGGRRRRQHQERIEVPIPEVQQIP